MQKGFAFTRFADRLTSIAQLSEEDLEFLTKMPSAIGHFTSHNQVLRGEDQPSRCCLLLQGYLCWRDEKSGQITSIFVPGDVPDLHTVIAPRLTARLTTLGPAVVAFVPHAFLRQIPLFSPGLCRAFQLLGLADAACLRSWIVNLGSRDSLARVAHLICEIVARLRAVGLAMDFRFPSPFTQSDLAEACAISAVHANRVIQELRRRQLLQWKSRTITILDWDVLCQLAEFEPGYLGLNDTGTSDRREQLRLISPALEAEFSISR